MEVDTAVREALEVQVFEHEPGQAALGLRDAVGELGPKAVAGGLLDAAAVALRRMVAETDEASISTSWSNAWPSTAPWPPTASACRTSQMTPARASG
jgi:hypothetical protein